jgi:hypothetical protein
MSILRCNAEGLPMTDRLKRLILFAVTAVPLTPVRVAKRWEWQKDKGKSWQKSGRAQWPRK